MFWEPVDFALGRSAALATQLCSAYRFWLKQTSAVETILKNELMKLFSESAECMNRSGLSAEKHEEMSARLKCQWCTGEQKQEVGLPTQ